MNKTYRAGYVDAQRGLPPQSTGAEYVAGYNAAVEYERREYEEEDEEQPK